MKKDTQRLLAYNMSKKIEEHELENVLAGGTMQPTGYGTYINGFDGSVDMSAD